MIMKMGMNKYSEDGGQDEEPPEIYIVIPVVLVRAVISTWVI